MATTTTINQFPIPQLADTPNIETAIHPLANAIDTVACPRFSTTSVRDSRITAPVQGQLCYVTGTTELYMYNGSVWVSAKPRIAYKASDQTVTASTSVVADDSLILSVESNSKYTGVLHISYLAPAAGDLKWQILGPPGAAVSYHWLMLESGATTSRDLITGSEFSQGAVASGGIDATPMYAMIKVHASISSTSGVLALYWAQLAASGATTVYNGSTMELWKMG